MGNYRFRISDMIPNAWFYKLKDMTKTRNPNSSNNFKKKLPSLPTKSQKPNQSDTHFLDPPRKSSGRRTRRKTIYKPSTRPDTSVSDNYRCRATLNSVWTKPEPTQAQGYFISSTDSSPDLPESPVSESESDTIDAPQAFNGLASWSSSCSCRFSSSDTDIVINMSERSYTMKMEMSDGFDTISELDLPSILTKPAKTNAICEKTKPANPLTRKSVSYSSGVKVRVNSPRLASKKTLSHGGKRVSKSRGKCISESFAIVKSSLDPQEDFRNSMVEMIVENNIRASKDLEELLACYLSLNSDENHDMIIKAFEQIFLNMPHLQL